MTFVCVADATILLLPMSQIYDKTEGSSVRRKSRGIVLTSPRTHSNDP